MKINGKDAFKTWGVFLQERAEGKLLLPANNKPIVTNKSRLEHGKRVVIDEIYIDERDVILSFCISASSRAEFKQRYQAFISELRCELLSKLSIFDTTNNTFPICSSEQ